MNKCEFSDHGHKPVRISGRRRELTRFRVSSFCEIPQETHLLQGPGEWWITPNDLVSCLDLSGHGHCQVMGMNRCECLGHGHESV